MVKLVLVRHGESTANAANVYTGWNDVPLSPKGIKQAIKSGQRLKQLPDFLPTHIHTSVLSRAIVTANIISDCCRLSWLPITKTWRLNERHYGALRGLNKAYSRQVYGADQVLLWRRGFNAVPPEASTGPIERVYQQLDPHLLPRAESLHQTQLRVMPYYNDNVAKLLRQGQDQLIVAHGSSLRALIKKLEAIDDHAIIHLEVPNAQPIVYTMTSQLQIINKVILS